MSKRSDFPKVPKDFYATVDPKAIPPKFIECIRGKTYAEPCYGDGDLEDLLVDVAICNWRSDVRETVGSSKVIDAMDITGGMFERMGIDLIVTNPPFSRKVLLPLIDHFINLKPTWLLLPAGFMNNIYFGPYMRKCTKVISIGRVCWYPQEGKRVASTDDFCWYYWPKGAKEEAGPIFIGRE